MTDIPASDRTVSKSDNVLDYENLTDAQREAIAKTRDSLITELSKLITDDVNAIVVRIDAAAKDAKSGPFDILEWFRSNIDADELAKFPRPGSKLGDNPDIYKEVYFRDGNKKFKPTSFYLKFFLNAFPEGQRIAKTMRMIELAGNEKADHTEIPQDIRDLNPIQLDAMKKDLTDQQNRGVRSIRDAIALHMQFELVNELPGVTAEPELDDNGHVAKIAKPILVYDTNKPRQVWGHYSISGFMQFDPEKAAELGGTFDALKLTAKREKATDDNTGGTGDKPVVINTNSTMAARLNDVAEYISNKLMPEGSRNREIYALFVKDQVNGPDGNDLIYNLNEIKLFVDGILNIPSVQSKLEQISAKKNAA